MYIQLLILIAALALIIYGADFLIDGASDLARRLGLSEFVIGLTIVAIGTSAPEAIVSIVGAVNKNSEIAIGNVIGSNIFNTLLILGLTALFVPIEITKENKKKDIPMNIVTTILLFILGMNYKLFGVGENNISRIDGIIFLIIFVLYIYSSLRKKNQSNTNDTQIKFKYSSLLAVIFIIGGLAALIFGGQLFVDSAINIAKYMGVSDKFIAVTILAGGTSLPELATCIVAAKKKKGALALGNILGSNIFNILMVLGVSSIICPISISSIDIVDFSVLFLSAIMIWIAVFTGEKNKIDKYDSIAFLLLEILFILRLIIKE